VNAAHYGWIAIDWAPADPRISLQLRDGEGAVLLDHRVTLSELQP